MSDQSDRSVTPAVVTSLMWSASESKLIAGATRDGGSTWQSLARGSSTLETDYLNGEIAMLGRLHGVATPVNELLQQLAAEAARAGTKPGSMSLDELIARVQTLA